MKQLKGAKLVPPVHVHQNFDDLLPVMRTAARVLVPQVNHSYSARKKFWLPQVKKIFLDNSIG